MKVFCFISILLWASPLVAQEPAITITGAVVDSASGERIPYASVSIVGTLAGTMADVNGYFILRNVHPENASVRASAVGYQSKDFRVERHGDEPVIMNLKIPESPMTMPTVEVVGKSVTGTAGTTIITPTQLQNTTGIFKNDVVQYVTQLPGVVTVSGISSQYYVRGGGPDENLVLLDGMQVYNLSHAFGLLSFVDPMIVKVANFSVGGFQSEYGGRLSSVFDIQTIDGDKNEFKAKGTFDLLSTDALLTGPLFGDGNSSFVAFYRRPLFQNTLQKFYSLGLPFDYDDGFAKATVDFPGQGHVNAEYMTSGDRVRQQSVDEPDFTWGNNSGAVSGSFIVGDQFDLKFSISYTSYRAEQLPKQSQDVGYQLDEITTPSFYGDVTSFSDSRDQFDLGLLFTFPTYNYTFTNKYGGSIQENVPEIEPQIWTKYIFNPQGRFSFEVGLRSDMQRTFQRLAGAPGGYLPEPRITVTVKPEDQIALYANFGIYHQRIMDLNDENLVFTPFDVLAPLPENNGDEASNQYVLGCKMEPTILTSVKIELYYKTLSNLAEVNLDKVYDYESDFIFGTGSAYGADVSVKYDAGESFYIQGGYSYSYTTRSFSGETYFPRYDVRDQLNLSGGVEPLKDLWFRARLKLTSGLSYTPVSGYFGTIQFDPSDLPSYTNQALYAQALFGKINSARLPGYKSLDLSASYDLNLGWTSFNLQGTLINLLDTKNVFYINNITGNVVYQLPTIFNLSLGWNF